MDIKKIFELCDKSIYENKFIKLPDNILLQLDEQMIVAILGKYSGKNLIMLPEYEIAFFDWLKLCDNEVWCDLWQSDDAMPYLVSIDFLPTFLNKDGRGFPICDLANTDNYYFTMAQMVDEESNIMIETARTLFKENKELTVAQMLALEISIDPVDIWHFAYRHKIDLDVAKQAVQSLVEDNALVHLTHAEHLSNFI